MPNSLTKRLNLARGFLSREPATRYQTKHRLFAYLAKNSGFRLYDAYTTWSDDAAYRALWQGSPWNVNDLDARRFVMHQLARSLPHVPGDTAECGAGTGVTSYIIMKTLGATGKTHHVFDSFEGLSEPTPEDTVQTSQVFKWRKHDISYSEDLVRRNLGNPQNVKLHKGWIPSRFGEIEDRTFCLVHIDVDIYEPTRDSVQFFYPRMERGGVVVCDDYGFSSCPGAKKAMDDFAESVGRTVIHLPTGQGVMIR